MYQGNIITSIKGKWIALINDSIRSFVRINLNKDATEQVKDSHTPPVCAHLNTAPNLVDNNDVMEPVKFH
jgi:hypothetical protein